MTNLYSLFYFVVSCWCFRSQVLAVRQNQINSICSNWNSVTYQSLNRGKTFATDSLEKLEYENRIEMLKDTYVTHDSVKLNNGLRRCQFLQKLFTDLGEKKRDFYVIEANNSGSKTLLRDFVVYSNSNHHANVDIYIVGRKGWFKQAQVKNLKCEIVDGFEKNYAKSGTGFNEDDIIITKFKADEVEYSDYFLGGALSTSSGVKEILATHNTKNFIK